MKLGRHFDDEDLDLYYTMQLTTKESEFLLG